MKYIRTKYGTIEINKEEIEREIVDEADTIEELCDGFIGLSTKSYPNRPDIEPNIYYFNKPFEFGFLVGVVDEMR